MTHLEITLSIYLLILAAITIRNYIIIFKTIKQARDQITISKKLIAENKSNLDEMNRLAAELRHCKEINRRLTTTRTRIPETEEIAKVLIEHVGPIVKASVIMETTAALTRLNVEKKMLNHEQI